MNIDKLETVIDKLTEKVRVLSFSFHDPDLASEAESARDAAVEALETYLELAGEDWEKREAEEEE